MIGDHKLEMLKENLSDLLKTRYILKLFYYTSFASKIIPIPLTSKK
jgi:hypothetical protein